MNTLQEFLARYRLRRYARTSGKAVARGPKLKENVLAKLHELPEEYHEDFTRAYMSVTYHAATISHGLADELFRGLTQGVHQYRRETREDQS